MYPEKSKNVDYEQAYRFDEEYRRGRRNGILYVVTVLLVSGAFVWLHNEVLHSMYAEHHILETVIVPFNRAQATLTQNTYEGVVYLNIRGKGQVTDTRFSDAFFEYSRYTSRFQLAEQFGLEIDGHRAAVMFNVKQASDYHVEQSVYEVYYRVDNGPRPISFRISDSMTEDNTGEFTIGIGKIYGVSIDWSSGG